MTANHNLQLDQEVMVRIRTVNLLRLIFASPIIMLIAILALGIWVDVIVSFKDIIKNTFAHGNFTEYISYIYSSLVHSRMIVQILASLLTLTGIAFVIMSLKKIKKEGLSGLYNFGWRG